MSTLCGATSVERPRRLSETTSCPVSRVSASFTYVTVRRRSAAGRSSSLTGVSTIATASVAWSITERSRDACFVETSAKPAIACIRATVKSSTVQSARTKSMKTASWPRPTARGTSRSEQSLNDAAAVAAREDRPPFDEGDERAEEHEEAELACRRP